MVPINAVAVWNVAPEQNNYANQNGRLTLAISSTKTWSSVTGVLAELTFEVQPGATAQYSWPITVLAAEAFTDGYAAQALATSQASFIGRNPLPPTLGQFGHSENGFSFVLNGDAGAGYAVEVSEDLLNWRAIISGQNETGSLIIVDPELSTADRRFYRVRLGE